VRARELALHRIVVHHEHAPVGATPLGVRGSIPHVGTNRLHQSRGLDGLDEELGETGRGRPGLFVPREESGEGEDGNVGAIGQGPYLAQ